MCVRLTFKNVNDVDVVQHLRIRSTAHYSAQHTSDPKNTPNVTIHFRRTNRLETRSSHGSPNALTTPEHTEGKKKVVQKLEIRQAHKLSLCPIDDLPVLAQIVLALEVFAAHLARERDLGTLVGALVDHQIVRFGEASLAILADEFALWSHLTTKVRPAIIVINSHHRKHCGWLVGSGGGGGGAGWLSMGWLSMMLSRCAVIGLR